jgi:hypothetical protein
VRACRSPEPSAFGEALPCAGAPTPLTTSVSPSRSLSLPSTPIVSGVSSGVVAASSVAEGASFVAVTVTVTAPIAVPPRPSLTV